MIRNDFVSNSSSSSYIIGFATEDAFNEFKNKILNEWGRDNKFGKLLIESFNRNICDKNDYDEKEFKRFDVLLRGVYQSTDGTFERLGPERLIYEEAYTDDERIEVFD